MDRSTLVTWLAVAYLLVSTAIVFIVALTFYRIMRTVGRAVFGPEPVFGTDARTRVIAFGVAALAFPSVLPWLVYLPVWVFVALFSDLPRSWLTNWQMAYQTCDSIPSVSVTQCLSLVGFGFLRAIGSGLSDGYRSIGVNEIPFRETVFLVTLWAVLAQLFSTTEPAGTDGQPKFRLQAAYARLSEVGRRNFHFFVLLAVAGYLSIAAIAAIPSLQETASVSEFVSADQLKKEIADSPRRIDVKEMEVSDPFRILEDYLRSPAQAAQTSATTRGTPSPSTQVSIVAPTVSAGSSQPAAGTSAATTPSGEDPIAAVVPAVQEAGTTARATPSEPPRGTVQPTAQSIPPPLDLGSGNRGIAGRRIRLEKQQRQELLRMLAELMRGNEEQAERAKTSAVTVYSVNLGRKGSREGSQHFQDVVAWYRNGIATLDEATSACERSIRRADGYWSDWSESVKADLVLAVLERTDNDMLMPSSPLFADENYKVFEEARGSCQPVRLNRVVPPRPALGSYLGPFSIVASWLLGTESLELALIVGLLGFGLLGSACSTFVRQQGTRSVGGVLVSDLASVVIRGLSAAVVVFLAVEGGLAIFTTNSTVPQPNPYVLLFTCLVAAVFSEDVWAWARGRLRDSFSGNEAEDSAAEEMTSPGSDKGGTA